MLADPDPFATVPPEPLDQLAAVAELEAVLDEVDDALRRLDAGTYGTCEACGEPITGDRLAAHPTAVTCERHPQLREQDREPDAAAPIGVEPPAALHLGEAATGQGPGTNPAP